MKSVIARFKCESVTNREGGWKEVSLRPVTSGKGNDDFNKYTPSGQLEMSISPETKAGEFFEPGKEYDLTFNEAK